MQQTIEFTPDFTWEEDMMVGTGVSMSSGPIGDMPVYPGSTDSEFPEPTATENTWWGLTVAAQNAIKATIPHKNVWVLDIYRNEAGIWSFSLPQYMTFNEALLGGTELSLDWHFQILTGQKPVNGSHMKLTCYNGDVEIPDDYHTQLRWLYESTGDSNWYYDTVSGMDCWLCPYVQTLFHSVPLSIYIHIDATPNEI